MTWMQKWASSQWTRWRNRSVIWLLCIWRKFPWDGLHKWLQQCCLPCSRYDEIALLRGIVVLSISSVFLYQIFIMHSPFNYWLLFCNKGNLLNLNCTLQSIYEIRPESKCLFLDNHDFAAPHSYSSIQNGRCSLDIVGFQKVWKYWWCYSSPGCKGFCQRTGQAWNGSETHVIHFENYVYTI